MYDAVVTVIPVNMSWVVTMSTYEQPIELMTAYVIRFSLHDGRIIEWTYATAADRDFDYSSLLVRWGITLK